MTAPPADRQTWRSFAVSGAVIALTVLDLTKINVGLPSIDRSLGATDGQLQLLVSGYVLAFGLSLMPAGRLGDVHSRRAMFVAGLAIFAAASLVCAVAPSIEVLLYGRVLQGLAAGVQMPQALGLTQQLFAGAERARAFGYVGSIIAISTAVGPILGGVLSQVDPEYGWRLLFWINVPVTALTLVMALRSLPREGPSGRSAELDPIGLLLFGIAGVGLMLPFVVIDGVSSGPLRWLWLVPALVGTAALVWWERRYEASGRTPVLPASLVRLPTFRTGLLIMTTFFAAISAIYFVVALYLQDGRGVTPLVAGLVNIPQAITSAIGAWVGGRLVIRYGRRLVLVGIVFVIVGVVALIPVAFVSSTVASPVLCSLALGVAGIGTGLVIAPNQTITVSEVPSSSAGVAASLTQVGQRIATAIGLAAMSAVYFAAVAGSGASSEGYRDSLINSTWLALALLLVSLVLAALDVRRTRRTAGPGPQ